ncbi:uncharacterized protein GJ701_002252 [Geothlypis trichas]
MELERSPDILDIAVFYRPAKEVTEYTFLEKEYKAQRRCPSLVHPCRTRHIILGCCENVAARISCYRLLETTTNDGFVKLPCRSHVSCLISLIRRRHSALLGSSTFRRTPGVMWSLFSFLWRKKHSCSHAIRCFKII